MTGTLDHLFLPWVATALPHPTPSAPRPGSRPPDGPRAPHWEGVLVPSLCQRSATDAPPPRPAQAGHGALARAWTAQLRCLPIRPHTPLVCPPRPSQGPSVPAAPRFLLSLQNLLLRHQQPSRGPVPAQHRRKGQPHLLFSPGKWGPWAALALLQVGGSVEGGAGTQTPCISEPRLLPGLLPLEQARRGAQEALPPHQPHPPHVPVLGHQPHHRHLGKLWQGEWGGYCPVASPFRPQHPLHPLTQPDASSPCAPRVIRWPCTWCDS